VASTIPCCWRFASPPIADLVEPRFASGTVASWLEAEEFLRFDVPLLGDTDVSQHRLGEIAESFRILGFGAGSSTMD
jgi:hypothetical protein